MMDNYRTQRELRLMREEERLESAKIQYFIYGLVVGLMSCGLASLVGLM